MKNSRVVTKVMVQTTPPSTSPSSGSGSRAIGPAKDQRACDARHIEGPNAQTTRSAPSSRCLTALKMRLQKTFEIRGPQKRIRVVNGAGKAEVDAGLVWLSNGARGLAAGRSRSRSSARSAIITLMASGSQPSRIVATGPSFGGSKQPRSDGNEFSQTVWVTRAATEMG